VKENEEGEIVITPLYSEATPLIRFASGDKGKYVKSEKCPCGRPFDGFESGSIARIDDMIKVKGVNIWQSAVENLLLGCKEVAEYKGEVFLDGKSREQISVSIEFHKDVHVERRKKC